MVDLMFILEMAWCVVLTSVVTARRALIYSGGALACGYVSWQVTPWVAHVFAPPMSPAMNWIQSQITLDVQNVMASLSMVPPEPVAGQPMIHSQWVAYHVVRILCFWMLNLAVFLLFIVVSHVTDAVWDVAHDKPVKRGHRLLSVSLGVCNGLYTMVLTGFLFANLAWFRSLTPLSKEAGRSVVVHWMVHVINTIHGT